MSRKELESQIPTSMVTLYFEMCFRENTFCEGGNKVIGVKPQRQRADDR